MSETLYATFSLPEEAEKAAGALLDRGVRAEDLSVVKTPGPGESVGTAPSVVASNVVHSPGPASAEPGPSGSVYGVTPEPEDAGQRSVEIDEPKDDTTATEDAKAGAIKGSMIGAGLGAVAVLAALVVPGVGFVLGAGALASAIAGVAATAGAGAATGAIVGYLKDMGVDEEVAGEYGHAIQQGGAVLAVTLPSGEVDEAEAAALLREHGATNVNHYAARGYVA